MVMYTGKFNRCPGKEDMTDAQQQIKEKERYSRNMGVGDCLSSVTYPREQKPPVRVALLHSALSAMNKNHVMPSSIKRQQKLYDHGQRTMIG